MPSTPKSSKQNAPSAAGKPEIVDAITPLVLTSVERIAELQKQSLDIAAEQTADWIGAWKKAFSLFPAALPTFGLDVASQTIQTALETQKGAIDLVVEQTKSAATAGKVKAAEYSKIVDGVTSTVRKSVEHSMETQKKALEIVAEQNQVIFENTRKQFGAAGGPASAIVDSFQRGADAVVEAQRSILNLTSQQYAAAAKA